MSGKIKYFLRTPRREISHPKSGHIDRTYRVHLMEYFGHTIRWRYFLTAVLWGQEALVWWPICGKVIFTRFSACSTWIIHKLSREPPLLMRNKNCSEICSKSLSKSGIEEVDYPFLCFWCSLFVGLSIFSFVNLLKTNKFKILSNNVPDYTFMHVKIYLRLFIN